MHLCYIWFELWLMLKMPLMQLSLQEKLSISFQVSFDELPLVKKLSG
jgi:hypothetical protein